MAAAALRNRSLTAAKLKDSMRQLRRYLDGEKHVERILVQKSDKVDVDREELIARHHEYAEKGGVDIDSEEMKEFIEPLIDGAVDMVDEATEKIEELNSDSDKQTSTEKARLELKAAKLNSEGIKKLVKELIDDIDKLIEEGTTRADTPSKADIIKVSTCLTELENKEDELIKSWNNIISKLSQDADIQAVNDAGSIVLTQVSQCRRRTQVFTASLSTPSPSVCDEAELSERGSTQSCKKSRET